MPLFFQTSFPSHVRRLAATLALLALVYGFRSAHTDLESRQSYLQTLATVAVVAPASPPPLDQASIDLAIVLYGIQIPAGAEYPVFDAALGDRGLTTRSTFMTKARVTVGPSAFESWGLLGSTLAHELEVHCNQNFLMIYLMDLSGLDGTSEAERQAYLHELRNAKRFNLARADTDLIADTMEFYYPNHVAGKDVFAGSLRAWLATNVLKSNSRTN